MYGHVSNNCISTGNVLVELSEDESTLITIYAKDVSCSIRIASTYYCITLFAPSGLGWKSRAVKLSFYTTSKTFREK